MPYDDGVNRREFLQRLGAGALLGAAGTYTAPARANSGSGAWTPPPVLKNPNILVIMLDQMRPPMWMNAAQSAMYSQTVAPNIMGIIQNNSYNFEQFFVAATVCTASRAALLTGLYAPQTAMYVTPDPGATAPALNPAFPTWGEALAALNPAYQGNVWWFGKWHLSDELNGSPLSQYGFNTRTYPGGPSGNPSPDGAANEGSDGGPCDGQVWASDAMIAGDFIGWLQGQAPAPSQAWCATVSLINPHDISYAPAWLQSSPFPPNGVPQPDIYFPPPSGSPPSVYGSQPSPWNWENLPQVPNKPALQVAYLGYLNRAFGSVSYWATFLNQYLWLQYLADQQVGLVLNALATSAFANNTIVVFLSDHGEFAGSHGLHTKGFAVYEESIRVPFYVQFPGQIGLIPMNQMCSGVDFFGLICDLATGGSGQWRLAYPDLANRQSMWSFLYNNSSETRVAPAPVGLPYVLHTFDQLQTIGGVTKSHIVCLRTKLDLNAGQIGAKLAYYSEWAPCTTYPDATTPDPEFYDYNPQTTNNTSETGNDYYSGNATTQNTIAQYAQVMGSPTPPATGLMASELNPPLVGTGTDGNPLSQALAAAQQTYFSFEGATGCAPK
ncbi:MAG: sulfatase-like hydrolase/transferase [Bryobacteraceae bacterium]